jgi:hypothetical protein
MYFTVFVLCRLSWMNILRRLVFQMPTRLDRLPHFLVPMDGLLTSLAPDPCNDSLRLQARMPTACTGLLTSPKTFHFSASCPINPGLQATSFGWILLRRIVITAHCNTSDSQGMLIFFSFALLSKSPSPATHYPAGANGPAAMRMPQTKNWPVGTTANCPPLSNRTAWRACLGLSSRFLPIVCWVPPQNSKQPVFLWAWTK